MSLVSVYTYNFLYRSCMLLNMPAHNVLILHTVHSYRHQTDRTILHNDICLILSKYVMFRYPKLPQIEPID